MQKLGDDPALVAEISITSLLPERYPQTVFRYRIRAI